MCVAAIIHKPVSLEYLRSMDRENPHGAGVAWLCDGALKFKRGLGPEDIFALQESAELTMPYLMHFRWATHGDVCPQLTHPFPTGLRAFAGELEGVADEVLIHNGVWHDYSDYFELIERSVSWKTLKETSDTAVAAYFYAEFPDIGDEIPWAVASARVKDGRLDIKKHGGWSQHEGNEYSNLTWLPRKYSVTSSRVWARGIRGGWEWADATPDRAGLDWDGWDEYVKWKYGDGAAAEACKVADGPDDAELMCRLAEKDSEAEMRREMGIADSDGYSVLESLDGDLISDDPKTVNDWLGQKNASPLSTYYKCAVCDVYTKSKSGVCQFCTEDLKKCEDTKSERVA